MVSRRACLVGFSGCFVSFEGKASSLGVVHDRLGVAALHQGRFPRTMSGGPRQGFKLRNPAAYVMALGIKALALSGVYSVNCLLILNCLGTVWSMQMEKLAYPKVAPVIKFKKTDWNVKELRSSITGLNYKNMRGIYRI